MARRLLLGLFGLGLASSAAAAAAPAASAASGFGRKPVQILAPTDAARTALKPVEEGLRAIESLEVRAFIVTGWAGLPCCGHDGPHQQRIDPP